MVVSERCAPLSFEIAMMARTIFGIVIVAYPTIIRDIISIA